MADVKISALPSYTGSAEDLRWFVMNNSGETETFKYSGYTSPLKKGTATNSIIANYLASGGNGLRDIIIGSGSTLASSGGDNIILNGTGNSITSGSKNVIINANTSTIVNGNNSATIGGVTHTNDSSSNSAFVGGDTNYMNGPRCFIGGGFSHALLNSGDSGIIGGRDHEFWIGNVFAGGGESHHIAPYTNSSRTAFIGGYDNEIGASSENSVHLGGYGNFIQETSPESGILAGRVNKIAGTPYGSIVGGRSNTVSGSSSYNSGIYASSASTISSSGTNNTIIGSVSSVITGTTISNSSIVGSKNCSIVTTGSTDAIYNSVGSTISGFTGVTMIGTTNRSAAMNDITYVENIHTFQTPSTQTQVQQSSAPFTGASAVNLALGGHPRLFVNSNTDIETIGVRDGQSFIIQIQNDGLGPYTLTWSNGDLSVYNTPYTYVFAGGNSGTGAGSLDLFRCEVFEDVIYVQRIEDFQ